MSGESPMGVERVAVGETAVTAELLRRIPNGGRKKILDSKEGREAIKKENPQWG